MLRRSSILFTNHFFVKLQESPVGSAESSGSGFSPLVGQSRPMDLGSAAVRQELTSSSTCGSAPTSPKTMAGAMSALASSPMQAVQTHPLNLASGLQRPSHHNVELLRSASSGSINSRSLPNIPSAMGRPGAGGLGSKVCKVNLTYYSVFKSLISPKKSYLTKWHSLKKGGKTFLSF